MGTAILDTSICELLQSTFVSDQAVLSLGRDTYIQSTELEVRILIAYAPLQGAHSFLWLNGFRPNDVRDFEIQGNVLSVLISPGKRISADRCMSTHKLDEVARSICSSRAEF